MTKDKSAKSTQSFLKISEIKMDTVVLEDSNHLAIIAVSSTNFALKSQEEQNALIYGYQSFVNTLDFDIQILMQSRKIDIHGYLTKLKQIMERQTNELLRVQTGEYIEFIDKLVENTNIMNKNFYIIIPYRQGLITTGSGSAEQQQKKPWFFASLFKKREDKTEEVTQNVQAFMDLKIKLDQRVSTVISGLSSLGLKSIQLQTPQLIELLYNSYNFETAPAFDMSKIGEIQIKGVEEAR